MILFIILYICSFFWFKQTPWKRWLCWVLGIAALGLGDPYASGRIAGLLIILQTGRWAYIGVVRLLIWVFERKR